MLIEEAGKKSYLLGYNRIVIWNSAIKGHIQLCLPYGKVFSFCSFLKE